jgi:galactonate dehydratase
MKITQVQTIPLRRMRLVRVLTDEGIEGLGEVAHDCHAATVAYAIRNMPLAGRNPLRIEAFYDDMTSGTYWRGGAIWMSAVSAVEQALWDIKGKLLGAPVYDLVGGAVRDRIPVYSHFRGTTPDEYAASALAAVEAGFRAIKTDPFPQTGGHNGSGRVLSPSELRLAAERIRASREAVGDDVAIMIECHGALSVNTAIRAAHALAPYEPYFLEEPVAPENPDEMAKVAAAVHLPIAAGERLYGRAEFRHLLELQAVDFIQPDLCHCGGFAEGRRIAALAETYHVRVLPHNPNGVLSTLVGLHFGACTPNFQMLETIGAGAMGNHGDREPIFQDLPGPVEGAMGLPSGPGWGIALTAEALKRYPPEA